MPTDRRPAKARPLLTSALSDLANRQPLGGSLPRAVGIELAGDAVGEFGVPYLGPTQAPWDSPAAAIDAESPAQDPAPTLAPGPKRAVAHQRKRERPTRR